jgi:ABC-type multidrug transport system fused ATPase/permease subunit
MKLSKTQWLWLSFFVASLLPAYLIASWQYEKKLSAINSILEREQSIHESTGKLIKNCDELNQATASPYGPNHTICKQGREMHEHTALAKEKLNMEKEHLQLSRWMSFIALIAAINFIGILLHKGKQLLNSE